MINHDPQPCLPQASPNWGLKSAKMKLIEIKNSRDYVFKPQFGGLGGQKGKKLYKKTISILSNEYIFPELINY